MEFEDVARTTFAARDFTGEPVPDEDLYAILDTARFAPSGGNRQGWRVIVVREPETRRRLAELSRPVWRRYVTEVRAGENPFNTVDPSAVTDSDVKATSADHPLLNRLDDLEQVPVLLVIAVDLRVVASIDKDLDRIGVISGASIYPFVWNLLLAARSRGYGGVLTTFLAGGEAAAKKLLALPAPYAVAAMVPLGKPVKQLTKLRRKPVEEFATWDRFDGEPLRRPE